MNNEEIGKLIKKIRKDNNLTQAMLAEKLGVTFQAVSKWENGKNIPDIAILKQISEDFNIDINSLLSGKEKEKQRSNKMKLIIAGLLIIIGTIIIIVSLQKDNMNLKVLTTDSNDFEVDGCVVFNENISSIYISSIDYKGEHTKEIYKEITFTLYEQNNDTLITVDEIKVDNSAENTFDEIIKNITFSVTNYEASCKSFESNNLYIKAKTISDDNKTETFEIPFSFDDTCGCE